MSLADTQAFKDWFADVQAEAERRGVSWLLSPNASEYLDYYEDEDTPAEVIETEIYYAQRSQ